MLASAVERELMRRHLEARVWKLCRFDLIACIDQHIKNPAAFLANEMLVPFHQGIEMLRATNHQYLQSFIGDKFLQVAVNGSEAHVGKPFPYPGVDLVGGWMRTVVLDRVPDDFELFGVSCFLFECSHHYAVRSSSRDWRVRESMTARA